MLTLKDIELMEKYFATKQEISDFRQEMNNNLLKFKDDIITEIVALRQETDINSSFRSKIDKQDKRIDRLETAVFS